VFVEDRVHAEVVTAIADLMGAAINTSQCGNSTNVKSLYRYQRSQVPWTNAYFMVDGDNQGNPFPNDQAFVHLPYYCIENLLLDPEILAIVSARSVDAVRQIMVAVFRHKKT
jgi:hypothetical protein